MHIIGIDPGLTGAIAILPEKRIVDMPTARVQSGKQIRTHYLPREMAAVLALYREDRAHAILEKQQPMPQQGVRSVFSIGEGFGIWLGILAALKIPTVIVSPQRWKKDMLAGMGKEKEAARLRAQDLFPELLHLLERVKDHNRAEALLIAEWGRKNS